MKNKIIYLIAISATFFVSYEQDSTVHVQDRKIASALNPGNNFSFNCLTKVYQHVYSGILDDPTKISSRRRYPYGANVQNNNMIQFGFESEFELNQLEGIAKHYKPKVRGLDENEST